MPKARKNAVSVACVAATEVESSAAMVGIAGRYMSMAKGPTAESSPSTSAERKREGCMT
jgi:hypothetical protein